MILVCTANGVQKWRGEQESRTREIMLLKMLQSILAVISSAADRTRIQRSLSPFRGAKRVPCPFRVSLFPSSSPSFPYPVVFSPYFSLSLSLPLSSSILRFVVNGLGTEQEERAFISSLLTAMRRKHDRISLPPPLSLFAWLWISQQITNAWTCSLLLPALRLWLTFACAWNGNAQTMCVQIFNYQALGSA